MSASDELFQGFVDLCEKLVCDAFVITDGRAVLTATLDHTVATKLCDIMIKRTNNPNWKVATIANGIELAYRCGYDQACQDINNHMSGEEANAAPEPKGETNGEDSELRYSNVPRKEETNSVHPLRERPER